MKSLRELYKIGRGPSSSHTIGPEKAAKLFLSENPNANHFKVTLFGSLAMTGRGHRTDWAILNVLGQDRTEIIFDTKAKNLPHPNTMLFETNGKKLQIYSVGGGAIKVEGRVDIDPKEVYSEKNFAEISAYCKAHNLKLYEYVIEKEGEDIIPYIRECWEAMKNAIREGLAVSGKLHGALGVERKAKLLYNQFHIDETQSTREKRLVSAYAYAVAEQNSESGTVVTAPTCGCCGVIPAALFYMQESKGFSDDEIINALLTAGIIGNVIKKNGSISGAEAGCQAEIGSACCMCAGALAELHQMNINQIECAAEIAMEHNIGLTCDPIYGLVQIPCIERNAVGAMTAINAMTLASFLGNEHKISLDMIIKTMKQTGKDLKLNYRETSTGGLAKMYVDSFK